MCFIYLKRIFKRNNNKNEKMIVLKKKLSIKKILKDNLLLILTVVSVLIGIGLGFILRINTNLSINEKAYIGFPGEVI